MAWWGWVLLGWVGLALVLGPLLGAALREADRRERLDRGLDPLPGAVARPRRRRIPVPPVAAAALLVGVVLEAIGLLVRVSGSEHGAGRIWSMDLPLAVPRMFVAGLLASAALAALFGAVRATGRRPWWTAVGLVAAVLAEVKVGGTVHARVLEATGVAGRPVLAVLGSAAVAGVVLTLLWSLSRDDRRDRRRVLTAFGGYAVAAVGLSGVSSLIGQSGGSAFLTALATFVEESGEVGGAVAVLTAVLVGVAPRLVLPADWALRRTADASTVDAPSSLPTRAIGPEH
jgi:hypothetical protein